MGYKTVNIATGIRLHYVETEKFKTNHISLSFIAPLERGTNAKNALIPNILMRGSAKYTDMAEINKQLDYLYASELSTKNTRRGAYQVFGFTGDILDNSYAPDGTDITDGFVEFLGELLTKPLIRDGVFDDEYVESEKNNLIDAVNAEINNKASWANQRLMSEMCKDEPFGLTVTGEVGDIEPLTSEAITLQYLYALTSYPIEIFFVGRCELDRLSDRLKNIFDGFVREPIALNPPPIKLTVDEVKLISEDMPVNQGKLVLGFRSRVTLKDESYAAAMLFNAVYGGGVTSKLFMNVREKMSLCYYCSSILDLSSGLMLVRSGIEVTNREIAENAILDQLEAIKRGDFTDDEFESARRFIANSYTELTDSAHALGSFHLGRLLDGVPSEPEKELEKLLSVSREELISAANQVVLDTVYFLNGTLGGEGNDDE